jgi:hypothetical protein
MLRKPLIGRCSLESTFSGIGAYSGDPCDIGFSSDEIDDLLPLLGFQKGSEANVTHWLSIEERPSAPAQLRLAPRRTAAHSAASPKG